MTDETNPATLIGQVSQIKLMADGSWRLYVDVQMEDIPQGIERWAHEHVGLVVVDYRKVQKEKGKTGKRQATGEPVTLKRGGKKEKPNG
jgi:hypothetical protein